MSNEKLRNYQWIMIMEGGNEDVEVDVTKQFNDESTRMKSYQFMEDKSKHDSQQVRNQKPSHV